MSEYISQKLFELKHNIRNLPGRLSWKIAYALPMEVVYLAAIRVWAHATVGEYSNTDVNSLTVTEALSRWNSV